MKVTQRPNITDKGPPATGEHQATEFPVVEAVMCGIRPLSEFLGRVVLTPQQAIGTEVLESQLPGALPSFEATVRIDHIFEQERCGLHADSPRVDVVGNRGTLPIVRELPSGSLLWQQ